MGRGQDNVPSVVTFMGLDTPSPNTLTECCRRDPEDGRGLPDLDAVLPDVLSRVLFCGHTALSSWDGPCHRTRVVQRAPRVQSGVHLRGTG
jgi:hypothetical protein